MQQIKMYKSDAYNSIMIYNKDGVFMRWGRTEDDDPFMSPFPELIDISISNRCSKGCSFCYRDSTPHGDLMSVEDFERIIKQVLKTYTVAIGGGEPTEHPDFIKFLEIAYENGVMPTYTTNGLNVSDEIIDATAKYCGAVGVSLDFYDDRWIETVRRFVDAGVNVNIHVVVSESDYKRVIDFLKGVENNQFPALSGAYSFVFLLYKPAGRADEKDLLCKESGIEFVDYVFNVYKGKIGVGFDSCFMVHVKMAEIAGKISPDWEVLDTCEGSRFSMFVDEHLVATTCSFDHDFDYGIRLSDEIGIDEVWNSEKFESFRTSLLENPFICPLFKKITGGN